MTSAALHLAYPFQEYVRFEREAGSKHEFVGGAILAMAGGSIEHGALCAAVLGLLREALRGRRCRAYDSNARIRVAATGNAYYPDASVVCGELVTDPADQLSILNPSLVVEVLSPSTAAYDAGEKLADYQRIPTLNEVVLVHHESKRVDVYTRETQGFVRTSFGPGERARLAVLGIDLSVDEVYFDPLSPAG
ncbi:MAG TPA: Uma2 family endonuclease [Polyangiaceae bacterium]